MSVGRFLGAVVVAATFASGPASAQMTELVSVPQVDPLGNDTSDSPSVSADGRFVAFTSKANNMVVGDVNTRADVFVRDRNTGTTVRVSVSSAGAAADRDCENPSISADGRFVAFDSTATNLVGADPDSVRDVFLHDRDTDVDGIFDEPGAISTVRASVDESGVARTRASRKPAVSGDGRWVAFEADEPSTKQDIRVFDRLAGTSTILSIDNDGFVGGGKSENPQISSSGRFLVFESDSDSLVPTDDNFAPDVFLVDRDADANGTFDEVLGTLTLRASVNSEEEEADGSSRYPDVSDDGRYVVFASVADNLDAGITNGKRDIFIRDIDDGVTFRISLGQGGVEGSSESTVPWISGDGRCVAFQSAASEFAGEDDNGERDVFVYDRDADFDGVFDDVGGTLLSRVSVGSLGEQANGPSGDVVRPVLSSDGLHAVFNSGAPNLVPDDTNGKRDVFAHGTSCSSDGFLFYPLTPCRLLDTRDEDGPVGGPPIDGRAERTFAAGGICGVPANAKAISVVISVVQPQSAGFFTLYPSTTSLPVASSVNFAAGGVTNNNQFLTLSGDGTGSFKVFNGAAGPADLIVDVTGYFG